MNFIAETKKVAGRSSIGKHKTGAVIVRNGRIISNGWSHVPHYKLRSKRSLHAEIHALARARHLNLNNTDIYVVTIAQSGSLVNAKPCLDCAIALKAAGVVTAFYSHNYLSLCELDLSTEEHFADLKVYELNGN
jgi:deoxycytidylate deaminase